MARVLVAGVAVADFVFEVDEMPTRPEKYRANGAAVIGGGNAANAAVAIARHGGEAMLAARLGDDPVGDLILADLQREGVDTRLIHRARGGASSFSSIYVDRAGERQIMNFRGKGLAENADSLTDANGADAILADNRWAPLTSKALAIAKANAIPGIVDVEAPVDPDVLGDASHAAFSMQGLTAYAPGASVADALRRARAQSGAWICVTDGANGVLFLDGDETRHIAAAKVEAVDTLAAGDVWHGVFALMLAEGSSETQAIVHANAAATLKCLTFGGRNGCPNRAATLQFLKETQTCN